MHQLNRPVAPACLNKYQHGKDNWNSVTQEDKLQIWQQLNTMQQYRCAYCEGGTKTASDDSNAHIEHFRQRSRYPQGTFKWANIFGSCNRQDSCGRHKDQLPDYSHEALIKMDDENPEEFLRFLPDGGVVQAGGVTEQQAHRATETIRIFNLNGSLCRIRKTYVTGYIQTAEELAQIAAEFEEEDWMPLLEEELASIADSPFATAIKHVLLPA